MKLNRSLDRYEGCTAYAVSSGSPAQMAHFVTDAKHDIAALADANFDLLKALKAIAGNGDGTGCNPQLMVDQAVSAITKFEARS